MENKKKRYYKLKETVWVVAEKVEAVIQSIDKTNVEVTVVMAYGDTKTLKMWEIDKLKFSKKKELDKKIPKGVLPAEGLSVLPERITLSDVRPLPITDEIRRLWHKTEKVTYFAPVKGGIVPTREEENAGRDCYARLEPTVIGDKEIYQIHIPQFTLAKIPLGFASYLNKEDLLSLKHERSSIGSTGLINVSGLIDSTYQGEVILQVIPLTSHIVISSEVKEKRFDELTNTYYVPYHKAIAQAVVFKQSEARDEVITYDELLNKPSNRGTGGWGSTGK